MITAHETSRERWLTAHPSLITTSVNRNILQPTEDNAIRRESNIQETVQEVTRKTKNKHKKRPSNAKKRSSNSKGKQVEASETSGTSGQSRTSEGEEGRAPMLKGMLRHHSSGSSSAKSDRSQLVDLVVEDTVAEDVERVRARKEGSSGWNEVEQRRFVFVILQ